jgi:hypothetical protein
MLFSRPSWLAFDLLFRHQLLTDYTRYTSFGFKSHLLENKLVLA